jgi:hypothetical protein
MAMNKKITGSAILLASLFLVVLGMRIVDLDGSHRPKQRPRAVVENLVKESQDICKKQALYAEPPAPLVVPALPLAFPHVSLEAHVPEFSPVASFPSRASPRPFSL